MPIGGVMMPMRRQHRQRDRHRDRYAQEHQDDE
jgi:hypothetical protein